MDTRPKKKVFLQITSNTEKENVFKSSPLRFTPALKWDVVNCIRCNAAQISAQEIIRTHSNFSLTSPSIFFCQMLPMKVKATCKSSANPGCLKQIMKKQEVAWEKNLGKAEFSLAYSQAGSSLCGFRLRLIKNIKSLHRKGSKTIRDLIHLIFWEATHIFPLEHSHC